MQFLIQKIPFLSELLFNGSFILLFSLNKYQKFTDYLSQESVENFLGIQSRIVPFVILFSIVIHYLHSLRFEDFFRKYLFSLIIFVPMLITWGDLEFCFWLSSIHLLSSVLALYENQQPVSLEKQGGAIFKMFKLQPAQIVMLTFAALVLGGASLLALPISSATGKPLAFIDCLFMSTSAACVTGLATISLKSDLSLFGQIIILILAQTGGLGIMILYASMTILLGKSIPMKERIIMQDILDVSSLEELINVIIDIIKYTFIIELWGAIVLTFAFTMEGFEFSKALYYGFFHSITAFCNAGFALFDNNLESFGTTPLVHLTIAILIILGGLGFSVLKELKLMVTQKKDHFQISTHSKIVIVTSAILLLSGTLIIFFGEFLNALDGYNVWEKFQISLFQSVTLRTAGFNTIPLINFHPHTIYLLSMFMFIGGSPGSTAGGIKTTSFAILVQSIRSTLKGRSSVEIFDRNIPNPVVVRTTALTMLAIIITTLFIFILMKLESEQTFLTLFFEVISAFGTVGLSLGITPYLSVLGKLAISIVMFIGRVGPLTLVLALGQQGNLTGRFEYPTGRVMIG